MALWMVFSACFSSLFFVRVMGTYIITGCWLFELTSKGNPMGWGCDSPRLSRELAKLVVPEPYTEYRLAIQTEVWKVDDAKVHDMEDFSVQFLIVVGDHTVFFGCFLFVFICLFICFLRVFSVVLWKSLNWFGAISFGSFWRCFLHEERLKLWAKKNCPEPCSLRKFGWAYESMRSGHHPLLLTFLFRNALCVRPNLNDERLVSTLGGDGNHVSNVNVTWWHHSWVEVPLSD